VFGGGFPRRISTPPRTSAGLYDEVIAYPLGSSIKQWGTYLPHSHRRTTKKRANTTSTASTTSRITTKGKGISQ
jgi:hypothetical protein